MLVPAAEGGGEPHRRRAGERRYTPYAIADDPSGQLSHNLKPHTLNEDGLTRRLLHVVDLVREPLEARVDALARRHGRFDDADVEPVLRL